MRAVSASAIMAHHQKPRPERARRLRRDSTVPKRFLWSVLRGGRLDGLKFRRQHPIGPFVADFYCHEVRLVIELDGRSHDDRGEQDRQRGVFLESQGMRVLHIGNDDVFEDLEAVVIAILRLAGRKCF